MMKLLYDELNFILDEDEKEQWEEEYGYEYVWWEEANITFDELFDNEYANQKYVVCGYQELWDGTYKGNKTKVYDSIKEAILASEEGFGMCRTDVYEGKYGRLYIITHHHDSIGGNKQEIRELSKLGRELYYYKNYSVEQLLKRKGATRNVKFTKKY